MAKLGKSPSPLDHLSAALREERCSATTLVNESLRLDQATSLNVVSELAADEALREVKRLDEGDRPLGRLLGAPPLIKDLEGWRGHPTREGSTVLGDPPAHDTATVAQRLLAEDAVALGELGADLDQLPPRARTPVAPCQSFTLERQGVVFRRARRLWK